MANPFGSGDSVARRWLEAPTARLILRPSYENHGISQACLEAWLHELSRQEPKEKEQRLLGLYAEVPGVGSVWRNVHVSGQLPAALYRHVEYIDSQPVRATVPCRAEDGTITGLRIQQYPSWQAPRVTDIILDDRVPEIGAWFGHPDSSPIFVPNLHVAILFSAYAPELPWRIQLKFKPEASEGEGVLWGGAGAEPDLRTLLQFAGPAPRRRVLVCELTPAEAARELAYASEVYHCPRTTMVSAQDYLRQRLTTLFQGGSGLQVLDEFRGGVLPAGWILDMAWEVARKFECVEAAAQLNEYIMGVPCAP